VEFGTAVAQWLRCCATNQKVAGSNPDGVMEFFIDINPSDRTMALGSTQPLTEMSTRNLSMFDPCIIAITFIFSGWCT
jgi:membrane-bound lytic murein transglycosylase B